MAALAGTAGAALGPGLASVTRAQLALMPLPLGQLAGRGSEKLQVDPTSGPVDNARAAKDSIAQDDTAATLAASGRVAGYELAYEGGAADQVSTEIELYRDEAAASRALAKHVGDFQRLDGTEVTPGARLAEVRTWTPAGDGLGDEARGLEALVVIDTLKVRGTVVGFRLGRLVGSASIVRSNGAYDRPAAEANARALLRRMQGVLDGAVKGDPVAIPAATTTTASGSAAPPKGAPAIRPAALAAADLPQGAKVSKETFKGADSDQLVELEREFELGSAKVGATRLLSLENDVTLYRTAATAGAFLAAVTGVYRSPQGTQLLQQALGGSDPALKGATFSIESVRQVKVGAGGTVVVSRIKAAAGSFRAVFAFARVGRVVTALVATGFASSTREADVLALLKRAAGRAASVR